jgi:ribosomal protein L20
LMAYHSTPHTTTGYSPFYLLHGREMVTPANENLKAKVPRRTQPVEEQMENLKARLRLAYKAVAVANKGAHGSNKRRYDRKAHLRSFEVGSYVYLYNPAVRPGRSKKFHNFWSGLLRVIAKRSDLNYELLGSQSRKFVVHVNRKKL